MGSLGTWGALRMCHNRGRYQRGRTTSKRSLKEPLNMERKRVVITGIGAITPIGITSEEIERSLKESRSGVKSISLFDADDLPVRFAGEASGFKPEDFLDAKEIRRNDRFIQLCLAATDVAVRDSGVALDRLRDAGVAVGVGLGGISSIEETTLELEKTGPRRVSPFFIPSILANL